MCVDPGAGPSQARKLSVLFTFKITQNARHLNSLAATGDGPALCIMFWPMVVVVCSTMA